MKCENCEAVLNDDVKSCPFCKEPLLKNSNPKLDGCDFKYTITSEADMNLLKETMNKSFKKKHRLKKLFGRKRKIKITKKTGGKKADISIRSGKEKIAGAFSAVSPQNKMYIAFYGAIAVIVLLAVLVSFSVKAFVNRERNLTPVIYTKGNSSYLYCGKEPVLLTENTIDINSLSDEDNVTSLPSVIESEGLAASSENGMYSYYFENYDIKTKSGSLVRIFNGRKKSAVSAAVHNSFVLSLDGKAVLFLQSADVNGDMGNLCYWNDKLKEPVKIAVDIDKNTFAFSENGSYVLFIRNYNYSEKGGDLCMYDLEDVEGESMVLDLGVKEVFGTDKSEDKIIYSKASENSEKLYDIYAITKSSERKTVFEKAVKKPIFSEKRDKLLVYAYNDESFCSLYSVSLKSNKSEKLASQMTTVIKTDGSFEKILYNKVYENKMIDCYLYTKGGKTTKIAENIKQASAELKGSNRFSVSDDLMSAVYISDFDDEKCGGKLYMSRIKSGEAKVTELADDVYTCRISPNGKNAVYGREYNKARESFDIYLYKKSASSLIEDNAEGAFFEITGDRKNVVFINDFEADGFSGTLNVIDLNGKTLVRAESCGAFSCVGENGVVYFNSYDEESSSWTLSFSQGKSKKDIDSGADGLIRYQR